MSHAATTPTPTSVEPRPSPARNVALDGLRGVAVLFVVLGHAGDRLFPRDQISQIPILRGFFSGGAVEVFFIIGGLIVTGSLLADHRAGTLDPVRFYLRRLVRLGVQLVPLAAAILLVHHLDSTDAWTDRGTVDSLTNMLTHTWNFYANAHLFEARSDLGHIWYLSVQQQVYLVLPLVLILLIARRRLLAIALGLTIVAITVWRYHVLDTQGWIPASTSTATRADGVLLGVLLAVSLIWLARWRARATGLAAASSLGLVVLLAISQEFDPYVFLRWWGVIFNLIATVLVWSIYAAPEQGRVSGWMSVPVLTYLGRASLAIYVWHLPIFAFVARHGGTWDWSTRAIVGLAILAVVVAASHRFIEEPTRRWLATNLRANRTGVIPV